MKAGRFVLIVLFLLSLVSFNTSSSKAEAFTAYVSGITMQNLSGSSAEVTVSYYDQTGSLVTSTTDTIDPYGVKDYATVPTNTGFKGSVVISSDQQIGAVSTLRGDNKGRGAYVGYSSGSTSISLPILMKNWGSSSWNTWVSVQNVGNEDATITMDYAACTGTSDKSVTGVKPYTMVTFNQATESCFTNAKVLTSGVITSTQPIVAVVVQESSIVNSMLVSPGFSSGDTAPVMPLMNSNNPDTTGWRTAINVFNNGSSDTDVTMTYINASDGSTCTETQTVPSKSAKTFAGNNLIVGPPAGVTTSCTIGARIVGSAYISGNSANQPLMATVNQDRGSLASAYGALYPSSGTPKVVFPQIQDRNGAASQWASSFMLMNVSDHTVYVKCTFANSTYAPESGPIDSYKAWENLQRGNISAGYVGSGQCTAYTDSSYNTVDSSAKIVAVVNIRGTGTGLYDLMMSYEGLNVTP